jgi:hypothetical protein
MNPGDSRDSALAAQRARLALIGRIRAEPDHGGAQASGSQSAASPPNLGRVNRVERRARSGGYRARYVFKRWLPCRSATGARPSSRPRCPKRRRTFSCRTGVLREDRTWRRWARGCGRPGRCSDGRLRSGADRAISRRAHRRSRVRSGADRPEGPHPLAPGWTAVTWRSHGCCDRAPRGRSPTTSRPRTRALRVPVECQRRVR